MITRVRKKDAPKAHWEEQVLVGQIPDFRINLYSASCSNCGKTSTQAKYFQDKVSYRFCPRCGMRMDVD